MTGNTTLPQELLAQLEETAQAEGRSADDLAREAVEKLLQDRRLQKLYAYGEESTRRTGIKEEDVPAVVKQWRRENPSNAHGH
jgi:Arc/MetJ-type ribon-helix-helix transcriptional regulator